MPAIPDSQIAAAAKQAGFNGQNLVIAVAVALAESGGRPDAKNTANRNGSTDFGLWQINSIHREILASGNWANPNDNARMAFTVFRQSGFRWRPWVTYNTGAHLRYMARARVAAGAASGTPSSPPDASNPGSGTEAPPDAPDGSSGPLDAIKDVARAVQDPRTWARVGMVLGGVILLLFAVMSATGNGQVSTGTKAAALTLARKAVIKV